MKGKGDPLRSNSNGIILIMLCKNGMDTAVYNPLYEDPIFMCGNEWLHALGTGMSGHMP